jgi:L-fuculose-phosphate aldolase
VTHDLREEVASAARTLAEEGLLIGTAGNVSAHDGSTVAVTATGVRLAECSPADVTLVDLDGTLVAGRLRPTSELDLHLAVYRASANRAVVHTHAPFATAVACALDELPVLHYQQLLLGGAIRVAPYATFGTPELAAHTLTALEGRHAALLANHGSVAVGDDLDSAVERALLLEWLAQLHHRASALGPPRFLDPAQQDAVIEAAIARHYGTTQENP